MFHVPPTEIFYTKWYNLDLACYQGLGDEIGRLEAVRKELEAKATDIAAERASNLDRLRAQAFADVSSRLEVCRFVAFFCPCEYYSTSSGNSINSFTVICWIGFVRVCKRKRHDCLHANLKAAVRIVCSIRWEISALNVSDLLN